jgi:polyphosphate kinase
VKGLSETITVRSIVGRFLEHSRIYRFGDPQSRPDSAGAHGRAGSHGKAGSHAARYFIGSADLMDRNLDRRVEALVPVTEPELCDRLEVVLALNLADDTWAWILDADGHWQRVQRREGISTQDRLMELARERSRRRRPTDPLTGIVPSGWAG